MSDLINLIAPSPETPTFNQYAAAPPSPEQQFQGYLDVNLNNLDRILGAQASAAPRQAQIQLDTLRQTGEGTLKNYIDLLTKYGGQLGAATQSANEAADPYSGLRKDFITKSFSSGAGGDPEVTDGFRQLLASLQGQDTSGATSLLNRAKSDFELGGRLPSDVSRHISDVSRTAASDRGLALSPLSAIEEILSQRKYSEQYRQQGFQNLSSAQALQLELDKFRHGATADTLRGLGNEKQQSFANLASLLGLNPTGRVGEAPSSFLQGSQPFSVGSPVGFASQDFVQNAYGQQSNAALQTQAANANFIQSIFGTQADLRGQNLEFTGSVLESAASGAGMAAACWIAAEIFDGWEDRRTHATRKYILQLAPTRFREWYLEHGRKVARRLRELPQIKDRLRPLFEQFAVMGEAYGI